MHSLPTNTTIYAWPKGLELTHPTKSPLYLDNCYRQHLQNHILDNLKLLPEDLLIKLSEFNEHNPPEAFNDKNTSNNSKINYLKIQDQRYGGFSPNFWQAAAADVAWFENLYIERRYYREVRAAWPSLPASVVRRAQILLPEEPYHIYLHDDYDGLCLLLSKTCPVTVFEPDVLTANWLKDQALTLGVNENLHFISGNVTDNTNEKYDLMVVSASAQTTAASFWRDLRAKLKPNGTIAVCLRHPWEEILEPLLKAIEFQIIKRWSEIDHFFVPKFFVLDGGGEIWLIKPPQTFVTPAAAQAFSETSQNSPYQMVDIHSLGENSLNPGALKQFAKALDLRAPNPVALRHIETYVDRSLLCWYDCLGLGLTAELWRSERHLSLTFMPYDPALEYAALSALACTLADENTRTSGMRVSFCAEM